MDMEQRRMIGTEEELVLRLLRGEDTEVVARETGIRPDELARWLDEYMKAGRKALDTVTGDSFNSEHLAMSTPTWNPWAQQGTWLPE